MSGWQEIQAFRKRHGSYQAAVTGLARFLNRFVSFELCMLGLSSGKPHDFETSDRYPARQVTEGDLFHQSLHPELQGVDFQFAFERNDICVANFDGSTIVGYVFASREPTEVIDGVTFFFPPWVFYSYGSMTAPSLRGQRLARTRWPVNTAARKRVPDCDSRDVFFMNVANAETLRSDVSDGVPSIRLGYAIWVRFRGKLWIWNSPAGRRNGLGFRPSA